MLDPNLIIETEASSLEDDTLEMQTQTHAVEGHIEREVDPSA